MIVLDATSAVPPYEQIRSQFRSQILAGKLLVGTRLPTIRRLAADLGIAVNTVARAYKELEGAGLIETRRRAGTVVAAGADDVQQRAHAAAISFANSMSGLGIDAAAALRLAKAALQSSSGPEGR